MNTKQRIDELEKQVAELKAQYEAEQLAAKLPYDGIARNADECSFAIRANGSIVELMNGGDSKCLSSANGFTSKEAAEREIKTRQLIRDAKIAMMADWGDVKCDWHDGKQNKFCIIIDKGMVRDDWFFNEYRFLSFRTEEARDAFRNSHTYEELILIITNGMGL